jgi:hypothetical protein
MGFCNFIISNGSERLFVSAPVMMLVEANINLLFRCYTSTPPAPLGKGGARKAFVANIKEIDIKRKILWLDWGNV